MTAIRRGGADDLDAVAAIQEASPGAAGWEVAEYLEQDFRVAIKGNRIVGFLVARTLAADEREILNLAVAPDFRRKGVAARCSITLSKGFAAPSFWKFGS